MIISDDTLNVVNFLQNYSNNNLRKPKDIQFILEIGAIKAIPEHIQQIIFLGKSIWNLNKSLSKSNDANANLQRELENSFYQFQDLLRTLLDGIDSPEVSERFLLVYLQPNSGCFRNTIDLSHDLSILKELIQHLYNQNKK